MSATDCRNKLIGFGCDIASANMAERGLKRLLQKVFPCIAVLVPSS